MFENFSPETQNPNPEMKRVNDVHSKFTEIYDNLLIFLQNRNITATAGAARSPDVLLLPPEQASIYNNFNLVSSWLDKNLSTIKDCANYFAEETYLDRKEIKLERIVTTQFFINKLLGGLEMIEMGQNNTKE